MRRRLTQIRALLRGRTNSSRGDDERPSAEAPKNRSAVTHQGRWCYGKTPLQTFADNAPLACEKMLAGAAEEVA
jgi:hypothetical protein